MSSGSADTARERGRVVDALLVAASTTKPSSPWRTTRRPRASRRYRSNNRGYLRNGGGDRSLHHPDETTDDKTTTDGGGTTLGGDDDLIEAVDQLLSSGGGRGMEVEDGLDLCRSSWRSVETMARALVVGQSVVSTISRCYSLPDLGRNSGARGAAVRRSARQAGTEVIHSSLLSSRLAAKALAIFRRLGQAPPTQPDSLYINSAKLPEAAKALDPALDDAAITTWMTANGFEQKSGKPSKSLEALSWTEYRQALAELSPTFRRHGITTTNSGERATLGTTPGGTNHAESGSRHHAGGCSSPKFPSLADECYRDPWEDLVDRTASCASPPRQRCGGLQDKGGGHHRGGGVGHCPPRSPGADSYGVLRRKRHAAVSLDYEGITKQLPQVMLPLDPSTLVDHIKAQGRRERKNPGSDGGVTSLWTLDSHERLLKMSLQKEQVSETANPRLVQPRQAAVKLRSRRNDFGRRREAEAGLMTRLARNAGVICRQAKVAEAKKTGRERLLTDQERVENQRAEESRRSLLVRAGAKHRASERRLKMEMLKSCIADQLRTIQENEDRAMDRVRRGKHVLRKGEGVDKIESMKRARSSPALRSNQVAEPAREPRLKPTVPPPDEDARWIYSSSGGSRGGAAASPTAPEQKPTVTVCSLGLEKGPADRTESAKAPPGRKAFSAAELAGEAKGGGTGGWVGGGEGEDEAGGGGTDRNNNGVEGTNFGCASSSAQASPAGRIATGTPAAVGAGASPAAGTAPAYLRGGSRESRTRGERSMRRYSSLGEARLIGSSQAPKKQSMSGRGADGSGAGYGLLTRSPGSPTRAAKGRKTGSRNGFGSRGTSSSPSVSPWCRQAAASPAEWGDRAEELSDGQDRGVVGWADDASASNA